MVICLELFLPNLGNAVRIIITSLVIIGSWLALRQAKPSWKRVVSTSCTSLGGAVVTFILSNHFQLGPVVASGLVGVLGAQVLAEERQLQLYLGAFVGMSSALRFPKFLPLILAGALGGVLFELLKEAWSGVGGRLGTLAATAVLIVLVVGGGGW